MKARVRKGLAACLVVLSVLAGCRLETERYGDGEFLKAHLPTERGVTTVEDVARAIGPPDEVRTPGDELWFIYRYREKTAYSLILTYYLDVFKWLRNDSKEAVLFVVFDRNDRLLYHACSRPGD